MDSMLVWGGTLLGAIILTEAVALSGLSSHGVRMGQDWLSPENVILLISDYVLSGLMVYLLIFGDNRLAVCFAIGAVGLTHLFRCVQRMVGMPRPFCANTAMALLNMAILVFAAILWGLCLGGGYNAPL